MTSVCGKCISMDLKLNDLVAVTNYFPVYGVIEDIGIVYLLIYSGGLSFLSISFGRLLIGTDFFSFVLYPKLFL